MKDGIFELTKDPACIFALFPDGGGRLLSPFRYNDPRLFYPTGRVNESYTNYPEIRKLTGTSGKLTSIYSSSLNLTDDGYFYNTSSSSVAYIRFTGFNFKGDSTDKTFFARFYLPKIFYSGTEANYYYARPFRVGTSSYPYTIEADMTSVSADSTYAIKGRWDSLVIRGNTGFEQGKWYKVSDVLPLIEHGIHELRYNEDKYRQYDSPNGWGTTQSARKALESLAKCIEDQTNGQEWQQIPLEHLYVAW